MARAGTPPRTDLRYLRYVVRIVDSGVVSRAARRASRRSRPCRSCGLRDHGLRKAIERIAPGAKVALQVPGEVVSLTQMHRHALDGDLVTILPRATGLPGATVLP